MFPLPLSASCSPGNHKQLSVTVRIYVLRGVLPVKRPKCVGFWDEH